MVRQVWLKELSELFAEPLDIEGNFAFKKAVSVHKNQQQTNDSFSEKWTKYNESEEKESLYRFQREWYLQLYGFKTEQELCKYLQSCKTIFDAGCGLGFKAAWLAKLAPHALVIGMDFSAAARHSAHSYADIDNLFFMQGDIAETGLRDSCIDYVSCDQVIMHTENPRQTFRELARICNHSREVACYFYAKKALPRELLDEHFRTACSTLSSDELWEMSEQVTELGKRLSALDVKFEAPEIPALGIKGGVYDIQRFIYWNFLKCFWNEELGPETSVIVNFDWYSPSNAQRFSEIEVRRIVADNDLRVVFFHGEEACYSGRFAKS